MSSIKRDVKKKAPPRPEAEILFSRHRWHRDSTSPIQGADGFNPYSSLIRDAAGNLYGTTLQGGAFNLGTVFKITP
jgi:uncharacterized repeat protein (TIGR03803 family)